MCIVNDVEKQNYEVIVSDKEHYPICSIYFASISSVCRFLDEVDLERCMIDVYRKKDLQFIDTSLLMDLWSGKNEIQN